MQSTEDLFTRFGPAYRWWATGTAMVAAIAVALSTTIVNVALPDVMGAFGIDQTKAQWLSTAFLAAMTATMLVTAWADRAFGQRATIVGALGLFAASSILGGMAPDENTLILARILQGAAAGVIQPLTMTIVFQVFPPEKRGSAMGIFGIGVVLAPALGPYVGGVLMDSFDWRFVFYLGVPFGLIGMVLGGMFLQTRQETGPRPSFDWIGFGLLSLFLVVVLSTLSNGQKQGWETDPILLGGTLSLILALAFVWWQWRNPKPLLDMRLFTNGAFAAASVVSFVLGAGLFGSTFLVPQFVQTIQGYTPTLAGLLLMPAGFALVIVFPIAGRLSDKFSSGTLIGAGLVIFAWSSYLSSGVEINTTFWMLAWWTALSRVGLGLVFPALSAGSLGVLPRTLISQGSGAMNFMRQLGGAFGVNLLTVVLERRSMFHADMLTATQTPDNPTVLSLITQVGGLMGQLGLPPWQQVPAAIWFLGQTVYAQASTAAYQDGFLITAVVFAVALAPTLLLERASRRRVRA
jgi:MFS transporter, DHA2 family, multidrug resistance protein